MKPLVVILGPTASGKSSAALGLAERYDGEIICADSRTVYKGMDIGTAKPTQAEQTRVRHRMLDIVEPDKSFTAAEFKRQALLWIDDCHARGKVPFLVGGTGLYIDGVIFDFAFLPPVVSKEREQLQAMSITELQKMISDLGIRLPENDRNPRHLIRAIETNGAVAVRKGLRQHTLVLGVERSKEELQARMKDRIRQMLDAGLKQEVEGLAERYGWDAPGLSAVGYREWQDYFSGQKTQEQVAADILTDSMQYAKRQRTWFRRNEHIKWVDNEVDAEELVRTFLQHK